MRTATWAQAQPPQQAESDWNWRTGVDAIRHQAAVAAALVSPRSSRPTSFARRSQDRDTSQVVAAAVCSLVLVLPEGLPALPSRDLTDESFYTRG